MTIIKIVDPDSGEVEEMGECPDCNGLGGFDASTDCEVYDDWHDCGTCEGEGLVPMRLEKGDEFIPERDACTPND